MKRVCSDWGIDYENKVSVMVTDGGANMKAAARELVGIRLHIVCVDHMLSRMTVVAIEDCLLFQTILTSVRNIVSFLKRSVKAADELRKLQVNDGKSEGEILKPIKDEPTRWLSNYQMLDRFIELSGKISTVLLNHTDHDMLTGTQLAAAKEGKELLQPIAQTITGLEAEQSSCAGKVIPLLHMLKRKINGVTPETEAAKELKLRLLKRFEEKFKDSELNEQFAIPTLLDPRFKAMYFAPVLHSRVLKNVSERVMAIARERQKSPEIPQLTETGSRTGTASSSLWDTHDMLVRQLTCSKADLSGGISGELRNFLHQPVVERSTNPLQVWENIKTEYPNVYPIAKDYLSRLVTSVPSERLFSRNGRTAQNRYRLNFLRMARLSFLASLPDEFWSF